ncbi:MAG TPA: FAD-dependent oxidoreductase [Thermomicrobiales bacterium]|nr:FAD-dependent oxidoreductase [Thermomicrobiales bacterium]
MKAIVIGAGVIGSSLTYRLARAGCTVTVIDQAGPAYGTTGYSFAWFNANSKTPQDYFALNQAGMREHLTLRDELGAAPWLHEGGNMVWAARDDDAGELEARVARLQSWGYPAEWLDRSAMTALEPRVLIEPDIEQGALFPTEGWIDGPALVRRLLDLAVFHGAVTRIPAEVVSIDQRGGRVTGVTLAHGERLDAHIVVNCAGPVADCVASLAGRVIPLSPTLGLTVRASVDDVAISRVMHAPRLHLRPDAEGLVMLHHGDADDGVTAGDSANAWVDALLERAREYVPEFGAVRLSRWAIVARPIPEDERTSAGLLHALPGYAEIVTHSGVTLGPLLARLIATEITSGEVDPLLAPFSPDRWR